MPGTSHQDLPKTHVMLFQYMCSYMCSRFHANFRSKICDHQKKANANAPGVRNKKPASANTNRKRHSYHKHCYSAAERGLCVYVCVFFVCWHWGVACLFCRRGAHILPAPAVKPENMPRPDRKDKSNDKQQRQRSYPLTSKA